MPAETLQLPRPLVNQLLRQAQRAEKFSQGWVLCDAHGQVRQVALAPDTEVLEAVADAPAPSALAFYRSSKLAPRSLTVAEIAALGQCTSIYLDIALDTQGVLQLHAWRIEATHAVEIQVTITETAAAIQ